MSSLSSPSPSFINCSFFINTHKLTDNISTIIPNKTVSIIVKSILEHTDEIAEEHYAHPAEALVRPESAEEIAAIMKLANQRRVPVTPRGAAS